MAGAAVASVTATVLVFIVTASVLVFSVIAFEFMLTLESMTESELFITTESSWPALEAVMDADNSDKLTAVLAALVEIDE